MKRRILEILLSIFILVFFEKANGQGSQTSRSVNAYKTHVKVVIDGVLDDEIWKNVPTVDSFINKWPTENGKALLQTEVRIAYNEQYIYFGVKAYMAGKAPVIQSLKRDINPYYSDGVSV